MLRYRGLLIDTEKSYKRPVQAFFNSLSEAKDWMVKVLAGASDSASVVIYEMRETEIDNVKKSELPLVQTDDQSSIPQIQQAQGAASKS